MNLRRLAESLPDPVVEELTAVGRTLERQASAGEIEEVTDPQESEIVREALREKGAEDELRPEQAKNYLDRQRRRDS